ncbi:MAG: hypothetical protein M3Z30_06805, partial [Gemmatimonadota bacterium]|nr:hypothetical protein [Gemmatimonadota bacterium]
MVGLAAYVDGKTLSSTPHSWTERPCRPRRIRGRKDLVILAAFVDGKTSSSSPQAWTERPCRPRSIRGRKDLVILAAGVDPRRVAPLRYRRVAGESDLSVSPGQFECVVKRYR